MGECPRIMLHPPPELSLSVPQLSLTISILVHYGPGSFWYSYLQLYKSTENQVAGIFIYL